MHRHHIELNKKGMRKALKMLPVVARAEYGTLIAVLLGSVIYTLGVMAFTVPFRLPDSGVTGIAVVLKYAFGISLPLTTSIANVALLAWAWRELSSRVVLWTIFSVALIAILMKVMDGMPYIVTDQKLLIAFMGGAIKGFGAGIVLRSGVTMGGLDIVILYLQKRYGIEVGKYNFYINMCIIGASSLVVGMENAMLGFAGIYASSLMIDSTISAFDKRRLVLVVTKDPCPIVSFISMNLVRGSTLIDAHGGFSGEERPTIMCVLTRRQTVELKRFLAENQPKAFMIVTDASEVMGRGFKAWK